MPPFARLISALFRPGRPATRIWFAAAAVTLAVPASPAHAQLLKRIKQAAAEKAAEAAGRKVLGEDRKDSTAAPSAADAGSAAAPARAASGAASPTRTSAPTKLEITPERIDQFLVAMEPFREVARLREAHAAAERKFEEYNKCAATAAQKMAAAMTAGTYTGPTKAQQAEIDRLLEVSSKLSEQLLATMQSGDTVKIRILTDSSVRTSSRAQALMNPYLGKMCGSTPPTQPARLDEYKLGKAALPRRIDGWTPAQFGLMRERIAIYLLAPEKASLTPEERAAVDGKRAGFQPYLAMWRETGDWKGWGELFSAWK